jgi:hypothetical protein
LCLRFVLLWFTNVQLSFSQCKQKVWLFSSSDFLHVKWHLGHSIWPWISLRCRLCSFKFFSILQHWWHFTLISSPPWILMCLFRLCLSWNVLLQSWHGKNPFFWMVLFVLAIETGITSLIVDICNNELSKYL